MHWLSFGVVATFVIALTACLHLQHENDKRVGNRMAIGVLSTVNIILDVAWVDMRLHPTGCSSSVCDAEVRYGIAALVFVVVPVIIFTVGTVAVVRARWSDLKTEEVASFGNITLVFLSFANPECIILLPWKTDAYGSGGSPFPNKDAYHLSMSKFVQVIPQFLIQVKSRTLPAFKAFRHRSGCFVSCTMFFFKLQFD